MDVVGNKVEMAAIIGYDGEVCSLPRPARHHNIIKYMAEVLNHPTPITGEQGFILTDGSFVNRETAKMHAVFNEQLIEGHSRLDILFSECIW